MRSRLFFLAIVLPILLTIVGCEKDYYVAEHSLLQNQSYTQDVRVQGQEFNGLLIENCTFDGGELYISDVDSVTVRNCTFKNQKKNGIRIGFGGEASHIIIENCSFKDIGSNGIDSHEDAPNCIIRDCYFESCALSDVGSAMGQPHHGIYWKGENVQILDNEFRTGEQNNGNAISTRSSGIISGNRIYGAKKYAIMYYADHPGGDSLFIENNFIYESKNGIGITTPSILEYHNKNVHVRFNTIYHSDNYSMYLSKDFETTTNVQFYGNIVVHQTEEYLKTFYEVTEFSNLFSTIDVGFVDAEGEDLHLLGTSSAIDYCIGLSQFPSHDIDGDLRIITSLDAGADEKN